MGDTATGMNQTLSKVEEVNPGLFDVILVLFLLFSKASASLEHIHLL